MLDFLMDHAEAIVSTLVGAIIGYLVSLRFARSGSKKLFTWAVKTDEWLVGTNAPPGLQVTFKGTNVANPRLLTLRIANGGSKGIRPSDIIHPLRIVVPDAKIASAEYERERMVSQTPPELQQESEDTLQLGGLEMNPRDSFVLRLVVDGGRRRDVHMTGAMFEESSPPRRTDEGAPPSRVAVYLPAIFTFIAPSAFFAGALYNLFAPLPADSEVTRGNQVFFLVAVTVVVVLPMMYWSIRMIKSENRRRRALLTSAAAAEMRRDT